MESLSTILTQDYPRSLAGNLKYRSELLELCERDQEAAGLVKNICRQDILFWINCFCWTKDQRKSNDVLPFICYDFQSTDVIKNIESHINNKKDLLIEKTRDMGVSWMILFVFTHKWLFESGSDFRVGSRKEEYVDKLNDIDTLIEKVRFNLKRQPSWMLSRNFNYDDHLGYMRIINPENGNAIVGESANPNFGSGGRRKAILLDEFSKWDNSIAEAAWTATADVTPSRIVCSTPLGSANKFAILASGTKEKIDKLTLHWTLHPEKSKSVYEIIGDQKVPIKDSKTAFDKWIKERSTLRIRSPWYDAEAKRRSESDLAQEVDIDYLRSGRPFFSIRELSKQKIWEFMRTIPGDSIPYGKFIKGLLVEVDHKVELRQLDSGWLRIFELPKEGYQYVVPGDTAEGLPKGDDSALIVREKITRNVVACANGLYKPDDFAIKLHHAAKFYNDAEIGPENNNHGYSTVQDLLKMDCKVYHTKNRDAEGNVTSIKPGFTTTVKSRPEILDQMEEEIRKSVFELRDEILINQCMTFVFNEKNGKPEADGSFLDDMVIACAIGGQLIKESPYKATSEVDEATAALAHEYQRPMDKF